MDHQELSALVAPRPAHGRHHLLKHPLPNTDVEKHFGTLDVKDVQKVISSMGQRELQVSVVGGGIIEGSGLSSGCCSLSPTSDFVLCCHSGQVQRGLFQCHEVEQQHLATPKADGRYDSPLAHRYREHTCHTCSLADHGSG